MIYMSRRVDFSAAHVYRKEAWNEEENLRVFGACSNPNGHGHDYVLEVMIRGKLDDKSGIVVNIVDIDRVVKGIVQSELDGKFLDREHDYFKENIPTTENIVEYLWSNLDGAFPNCELYKIRLQENPFLYSERERESMVTLTRKYHFSAAHRLHSDQLTAEENRDLFGKCNNPHGHGHNYRLEVTVSGKPDRETGMIANLAELDQIVESIVLDKFDHKHLNLDTEEFKNLNPTSEVVAMVIWEMLNPYLPNLSKVGVWETDKNYFEYCGPIKE